MMMALSRILAHFQVAFAYRMPFTATHLTVRLVIAALLVPLIGLVLSSAIGFSDRSALTDQDIARFLLTPAGAFSALTAISLGIAAAVLDVTVMMHTLATRETRVVPAIRQGFAFVVPRFPHLLRFSLALLLRILGNTLPFVLVMAAVAYWAFHDYDINYYLTHRPPRAVLAAGIIAALTIGLGLILLPRLVSWAFALQLVVGRGMRPSAAFTESAALLKGRKVALFRQIVIWLVISILSTTATAALFGAAIGALPSLLGSNLQLIAGLTLTFLLIWGLVSAVVSALIKGTLARLLLSDFLEATGQNLPTGVTSDWRRVPLWAVLGLASACVVAGLILANELLKRVSEPQIVEIVAHRGAAGARPENTMAAVLKAIEDRADWVEIDVQETADGEVVVAHDSDFMKMAGEDLKIWDATMADLARIDVGSWFDPAYAAERTPTLRDVLLAARGKSKVMIELKYYGHDKNLEERVARIVEEAAMSGQIAVISLKVPGVEKMRVLRPDWRTGILAAKALGDLSQLDTDFLAVNTGQVSLDLIKRSEASGKDLYAWTVDNPVTMSRMISMGVNGLITNEPALARQVMERRNALSAPERLLLWLADRFGIGSFRLVANERDA
jgi:glycerophosphoryl diester phosphodiesterase